MNEPPRIPRYRVEFVIGDYRARQARANELKASLYFEGHANSTTNPRADYAMCVVSTNASAASIALARRLAVQWGAAMDVGGANDTDIGYQTGVRIGGAGDYNLRYTDMPAVLGEPVFASNRVQALKAETDQGQDTIAGILVDAIRDTVPDGRLIVLSIGHQGKTSAPGDRGATWTGTRYTTEAGFVHAYLQRAADLLRTGAPTVSRETAHV